MVAKKEQTATVRARTLAGSASLLGLSLWLLSGCASHYNITLNNGTRITTNSKPRLSHGHYYYKDRSGQKTSISAGRVREIAPASMSKEEDANFKTRVVK